MPKHLKRCVDAQMHHKTRLGEVLKHLCDKGLRAFFCVFIRAQNLFEECLKTVPSLNDVSSLCVHIAVHSGLNVCMSGDGLQGLHISSQACRIGEITVSKDMCGCSVKVNGCFDSLHTSAIPQPFLTSLVPENAIAFSAEKNRRKA